MPSWRAKGFYRFRPSIISHSPIGTTILPLRGKHQVPRCLINFHGRQHTLRALKTHVGTIVPFGLGMLATTELATVRVWETSNNRIEFVRN